MNGFTKTCYFLGIMGLFNGAYSSTYVNVGVGGVYSNSNSGITANSSSLLYTPTAPGTSLFTLPNVNWQNSYDSGFNLSAALGSQYNEHWRTEIEFLYQNIQHSNYGTYGWLEQDSSNGAVYAQQPSNPISKSHNRANLYSFMTNAAYDIKNQSKWTPLISGGIGLSWLNSGRTQTYDIVTIDDPNTPLIETAPATQISPRLYGTAFTWQFKTGVAYAMNPTTSLVFQYRVFGTTNFKASNSEIITNPGAAGQGNFYVPQNDISGLITQALEITARFNV